MAFAPHRFHLLLPCGCFNAFEQDFHGSASGDEGTSTLVTTCGEDHVLDFVSRAHGALAITWRGFRLFVPVIRRNDVRAILEEFYSTPRAAMWPEVAHGYLYRCSRCRGIESRPEPMGALSWCVACTREHAKPRLEDEFPVPDMVLYNSYFIGTLAEYIGMMPAHAPETARGRMNAWLQQLSAWEVEKKARMPR